MHDLWTIRKSGGMWWARPPSECRCLMPRLCHTWVDAMEHALTAAHECPWAVAA